MIKQLGAIASSLAFLCGVAPCQDVTTVYVHYANAIDKPMVNDTTADQDVTVEITVEKPDGNTVDISVTSTIVNNQTTRRQLAADIAAKLEDKLQQNDLPRSWVKHRGASVFVTHTPPGVGKNKGTPKDPIKSPPKAKNSHGHTQTSTTGN